MLWVNHNESGFWPGDLALPGDTIRIIIDAEAACASSRRANTHRVHPRPLMSNISAYGPPGAGYCLLEGWPYPFTGCCWRPR